MTKTVTIFLTPKAESPNEGQIVALPDTVKLIINVEIDERGNETVTDTDDVVWIYSKVPPAGSGFNPFPNAPEAIDINVEVRFPPLNTPFGASPSNGSPSSLLPAPDSETYENIGINPLVPNKPRPDAAPPPTEAPGLTADSEPVEGPEKDYEYAIILTSRTNVNTVDPKIVVSRRHRRRRSE
ncbi:MAG: hypothetical protein ACKVZH_14065 [Blastocatellia bacterium]